MLGNSVALFVAWLTQFAIHNLEIQILRGDLIVYSNVTWQLMVSSAVCEQLTPSNAAPSIASSAVSWASVQMY